MYFVYSGNECLGYVTAINQMDALQKARKTWKCLLWVQQN
jgi:hypothetical protein